MREHTIKILRGLGWDVKIKHIRRYVTSCGCQGYDEHHIARRYGQSPMATGGVTIMSLCRGHVSVAVEANCHPNDNYCKQIGVALCLHRLPAFVWE